MEHFARHYSSNRHALFRALLTVPKYMSVKIHTDEIERRSKDLNAVVYGFVKKGILREFSGDSLPEVYWNGKVSSRSDG